jgi:hypothetical protein
MNLEGYCFKWIVVTGHITLYLRINDTHTHTRARARAPTHTHTHTYMEGKILEHRCMI